MFLLFTKSPALLTAHFTPPNHKGTQNFRYLVHQYSTLVRKRAWPGTDSITCLLVAVVKIFAKILIMLYFCEVLFKNIVMFKIFEHCKKLEQ